jgi:hypothetical protein
MESVMTPNNFFLFLLKMWTKAATRETREMTKMTLTMS